MNLEEENIYLRDLIRLQERIGNERDISRLLPLVAMEISSFLRAERTTVFLLDWDRMKLSTVYAQSLHGKTIDIELKIGLVGLCFLTKEIINISSAQDDSRFNPEFDDKTDFRTESLLIIPLIDEEGNVPAAIELLNKKTGVFTREDEKKGLRLASRLMKHNFLNSLEKGELQNFIVGLRKKTCCERGSLLYIDTDKGTIFSRITEGMDAVPLQINLNLGIAGLVAVTGKPMIVPDAYADCRFDRRIDLESSYHTRNILCVPIRNRDRKVLGVIEVINKIDASFTKLDRDNLQNLSSLMAISIENAILFEEQNKQFFSFLEVMAASIDAKDPLTAGHSSKVARYCVAIARELGFGQDDLDVIRVAALLHDYGKLGIDDKVLKKKGRLDKEEYDHIKEHVRFTEEILTKLHFSHKYRNVPQIASCHHERLDGSGYGHGYPGHKIPFMAKILAVADVFEALTAKRHYHEPKSAEDAFAIIEENTGTHFDENVVKALKAYWYAGREMDAES